METHGSVKIVLTVSYVLQILSLSASNKSIKWKIGGNNFM